MILFFITMCITFITLISIDGIWLFFSAKTIYIPMLKHLFKQQFSYNIALIFYILYAIGITKLIILPNNVLNQSTWQIVTNGFLLGLVSYGAYDLTNHATLPNWPTTITIVDMLWGAFLTMITAYITSSILLKYYH